MPGLAHGYAGRQGGVSAGPFHSLNLSFGVGDDPACVRENRRRFSRALGVDARDLVAVKQVHGTTVLSIGSRTECEGGSWTDGRSAGVADALLTDRTGTVLVG